MYKKVNQLEQKIKSTHNTIQKIDLMNDIAWELRDIDVKRGKIFAQDALDLAMKTDYKKGIADGLINGCYYIFEDYFFALSQATEALQLFEELSDLTGKCKTLTTLCWIEWSLDNFENAIEFGRKAQTLAVDIGDKALEAHALNNLALAYKRSGNLSLGISVYEQALELYKSLGDVFRESKLLVNLTNAHIAQENFEIAYDYIEKIQILDVDSQIIKGYTQHALGQIYAGLQDFPKAITRLDNAFEIASKHNFKQLILSVLLTCAEINADLKRESIAIEKLEYAITVAEKIGSDLYLFQCHKALSSIYESLKKHDLALIHFKLFHQTKEKIFNDTSTKRRQALETIHKTEINKREAEIFQLRNVQLENEIKERKRIEGLLHQQATTDMLTGVANRRFFKFTAENEIKRARRFNHDLTIALLDLDRFKEINDSYGHNIGDQVLTEFAKICKDNLREIDIFARYGGDEFIILFPETDVEQSKISIERLRKAAQRPLISIEDNEIIVGFSVGLSGLHPDTESLDDLLLDADKNLYKDKDQRRKNQTAN